MMKMLLDASATRDRQVRAQRTLELPRCAGVIMEAVAQNRGNVVGAHLIIALNNSKGCVHNTINKVVPSFRPTSRRRISSPTELAMTASHPNLGARLEDLSGTRSTANVVDFPRYPALSRFA
jgi:hypothetical protein